MDSMNIIEKELLAIGIHLQEGRDSPDDNISDFIYNFINNNEQICETGSISTTLLSIAVELVSSRYRLDNETSTILAHLNKNLKTLTVYEQGCFWHLKGYLSWRSDNELYRARREFNRSVARLEASKDDKTPQYLPRVFDSLGQLYHHQGIYPEAIDFFSKSLKLKMANNDDIGRGITLGNLGRLYLDLGKYENAIDFFSQDLELLEKDHENNKTVITQMLSHLGFCAFRLGDKNKAKEYYALCLAGAEKENNQSGVVFASLGMGEMAVKEMEFDKAEQFLDKVMELVDSHNFDETLDILFKARSSYLKGMLAYARGEYENALGNFSRSYKFYLSSLRISSIEKAEFLFEFARVYNKYGKDQKSAEMYRKALHLLEGTEATTLQSKLESELKKNYKESWLLHTAGRFIGQKSIGALLEQSGAQGFHGGIKDLVILFSDIRGFTTIIEENSDPDRIVSFLNDYLRNMTRCVDYYSGVTNRFIGDAIMALFTVPEPRPDDQERAVAAALAMRSELKNINDRFSGRIPEIDIGIGIHSGEVITGLIGSPQKRSFDIIGDAANTASRLESMTKHLGASILVSENIYNKLPGKYIIRPLGFYCPKGKSNPIAVADIMGEDDGSLEMDEMKREISLLEKSLDYFRNRDFPSACAGFRSLIAGIGKKSKRVSGYLLLLSRAEQYLENPPDRHWSGEITLDFK